MKLHELESHANIGGSLTDIHPEDMDSAHVGTPIKCQPPEKKETTPDSNLERAKRIRALLKQRAYKANPEQSETPQPSLQPANRSWINR